MVPGPAWLSQPRHSSQLQELPGSFALSWSFDNNRPQSRVTIPMAPPSGAQPETTSNGHPSQTARTMTDPNHLAPEDAFYAHSPPRKHRDGVPGSDSMANGADTAVAMARNVSATRSRRTREKERGRSASRRRKGVWKKLLWVKQSCTIRTLPPTLWCIRSAYVGCV